jgi:hypothetical protein
LVKRHSVSFWDAMLWVTAREAGCRLLFSEDLHDGQTLDGVTCINPFAARNQTLVEAALPKFRSLSLHTRWPQSRSATAIARRPPVPAHYDLDGGETARLEESCCAHVECPVINLHGGEA